MSFSLQREVAPVQIIAEIVLLGFSLILLPGMFILYYTIIYFFVKIFFYECLYFSEYDIRMFLFVFWLRNRPSFKYVRNKGNGGGSFKMFTDKYMGRGISRVMCMYAFLHYLFSCFCLMVSCFICRNLNLPLFQKGALARNGYFSPMRSISVVMK